VRSSSWGCGDGRRQPMSATGRSARRRPSVASVSRLEGSAHCRSSRPTTRGRSRASASTRSTKASTAWNCSPGSLLTVIGPWSPARMARRAAMAARRGSGDDRTHPRASARRPNGRVRSSSSARPAATLRLRARACSSASASRRVLPMPASPSTSMLADPPEPPGPVPRQASAAPGHARAAADLTPAWPCTRCYAAASADIGQPADVYQPRRPHADSVAPTSGGTWLERTEWEVLYVYVNR
jgi:hypothetical protein